MLKIWAHRNSINVQQVLWCCDELSLLFERADIGGPFGGNDRPWYLALEPTGLVPTISDDGFVLWESNVIVRYLAAKHGAGTLLWPEGGSAGAGGGRQVDGFPGHDPVGQPRAGVPGPGPDAAARKGRGPDRGVVPEGGRSLRGTRRPPERSGLRRRALAERGDIPLEAAAYRWFGLKIRRPSMPHLEVWYERLRDRPAYRRNVMLPLS